MVERPVHQNLFANRAGMYTEMRVFQFVHRLEKSLNEKEIALGVFLNIEGGV